MQSNWSPNNFRVVPESWHDYHQCPRHMKVGKWSNSANWSVDWAEMGECALGRSSSGLVPPQKLRGMGWDKLRSETIPWNTLLVRHIGYFTSIWSIWLESNWRTHHDQGGPPLFFSRDFINFEWLYLSDYLMDFDDQTLSTHLLTEFHQMVNFTWGTFLLDLLHFRV